MLPNNVEVHKNLLETRKWMDQNHNSCVAVARSMPQKYMEKFEKALIEQKSKSQQNSTE